MSSNSPGPIGWVGSAVSDVGHAIASGASAVGSAIGSAGSTVVHGVETAATSGASLVGGAVTGFGPIGGIIGGVNALAHGVSEGVGAIANAFPGAPKAPEPAQLPNTPSPTSPDPMTAQQTQSAMQNAATAQDYLPGRASTILTSGQGLLDQPYLARRTLMGY